MKKTLVLLIALLLVISLTSCGQKETVSTDLNSDISSKIQFSEQENTSSTISKEEETVNRITESMKLDTTATAVYRNFSEIGKIVDICTLYNLKGNGYENRFLVIDENGKLYEISMDKPYISGKYYKEIATDFKADKFIHMRTWIAVTDKNSEIVRGVHSPSSEDYIITSGSRYTFSSFVNEYVTEHDNMSRPHSNVAAIKFGGRLRIISYDDKAIYEEFSDKVIASFPSEEKIERVLDGGVKTNKYWYIGQSVISNEEELTEYAGISPIYECALTKVDFINDLILVRYCFDKYYFVTSDNTVYIVV